MASNFMKPNIHGAAISVLLYIFLNKRGCEVGISIATGPTYSTINSPSGVSLDRSRKQPCTEFPDSRALACIRTNSRIHPRTHRQRIRSTHELKHHETFIRTRLHSSSICGEPERVPLVLLSSASFFRFPFCVASRGRSTESNVPLSRLLK